ncbi:ATP/GTP-binding protein [uncultured Phascolarctobacterium sp.]|jgi:AAA15 family ATPase/GTPase|uniref:AAA family ATPase n=1 Tax=uncultured Phascolarctobacterium sp. TaxID=512296 RepID=UPI0025D95AD6|nr:ATP-binding protein [uncultured Phascolarctobacterium sp.]
MLIQFRFKNFKSFRDDTVLDFSATEDTENEYRIAKVGDERILTAAGIFGANASGKSNVIKAFRYMMEYVTSSVVYSRDKVRGINRLTPFLFDNKSKDAESLFEVFFSRETGRGYTIYNYGFSVSQNGVTEEWLNYKAASGKEYNSIFYRGKNELDLSGIPEKRRENIKISLEKETLILSLGSFLKINRFKIVIDWFMKNRITNFGNPRENEGLSHQAPTGFADSLDVQNQVMNYLAAFDSSIIGFDVEVLKSDDDGKQIINIKTKHKNLDGGTVLLPLSQESDGTLKMFALYQFIQDCIERGSVLLVDELNSRLHPLLVRNILITFFNPKVNIHHAQIIFTSHDLWQLKNNILRKDEIWFTDKDNDGISTLYSLADFEGVESESNYVENYMLGQYGAIPSLKALMHMEGKKHG